MTMICDVSHEVSRFRLRIRGELHELAAVQGYGGVFQGDAINLARFVARETRRDAAAPIRVLTQYRAFGERWIDVPANEFEIIGHVPGVPFRGVEVGRG